MVSIHVGFPTPSLPSVGNLITFEVTLLLTHFWRVLTTVRFPTLETFLFKCGVPDNHSQPFESRTRYWSGTLKAPSKVDVRATF